jgi:putative membrane fusion protein
MIIGVIVVILFGYLTQFREEAPEVCISRYGRLADQFGGQGLFVKSEEVIYAPFAGKVDLLVNGGTRYPSGKSVLTIEGVAGKKTFFIRESGVVSFAVDGLETTLKPAILSNLQRDYTEFRGKSSAIKDGEQVNAGRPLYKLVDNYSLHLLVQAPVDEVLRYGRGDKVWVTFENTTIVGWIKDIIKRQNLFVIQLERFPDEVADKRWVDLNVMANAFHGVIVPRKSIVEKDGKIGVYRMAESVIFFQPITIRGGTIEEVVVSGIERGVEILINPKEYMAKYQKSSEEEKITPSKSKDSADQANDGKAQKPENGEN